MHGAERGFPFAMLTTRCEVGGVGVVGWTIPLEPDPGTNPPSTPMLRIHCLLLNLATWSALAGYALVWRRNNQSSEGAVPRW